MYFFISGMQSFLWTISIFVAFFGVLHIISYELYSVILDFYNKSYLGMIINLIMLFIIFLLIMYRVFSKEMNNITSYISEICCNLEKASAGNLDIKIPLRSHDELAILAGSVNSMAENLNNLMEKQKEWDSERNNLITNLSHDLRTPLTSILGFINLIKQEEHDNEKIDHYCSIALNKAEQLKQLINMLFDFTKLTNSDFKINTVKINILELIQQTLIGFTPEFEKENMKYRILSDNKNIILNADPNLLVRAFENIITNTIKYAADGIYLDIDIYDDEEFVYAYFINYGKCIKDEDLLNVFDKYYRVQKTCAEKEGTGIGLSITKRIAELHGGSVTLSSSDEKTKFKFKLSKFLNT